MPNRLLIVLAEDDEDDRVLAAAALKDADMPARLRTVNDGAELLDYLKQRGEYADDQDAKRPALVLLDLNMPRMDGHETLRAIKQDPELRSIPVVVFTTSTSEDDIAKVYDEHGNSYITKPRDFPALVETMKSFSRYWTETSSLPSAA